MNRSVVKPWLPVFFLAAFYVTGVLVPLWEMVRESTRGEQGWTIARYLSLVDPANAGNFEALINSVFVSLCSVGFSAIIGFLLAFTVTQFDFPGRSIVGAVAVAPIALPPLVGVMAFLFVFGESGFLPRAIEILTPLKASRVALDGIPAIIVVHAYSFNVYFFLFFSSALRRIDASMLEAAAGMGANNRRIVRRIIFPELRPALVGASILTFMASMASFSAPLLFGGSHRFLTMLIYTTKLNGDLPLAAAQSLLLTVLAAGFFVVMYRLNGSEIIIHGSKGVSRSGRLQVGTFKRIVLLVLTLGVILLESLPLVVMVLLSLASEGAWTTQLVPSAFTFAHYQRLLSESSAFVPFRNSVVMAAAATAAAFVVGGAGAYLVAKGVLRRSRRVWDVVLTLPYAIPGTALGIAFILGFNTPSVFTGGRVLVGTVVLLPLAYLVKTYPLMMRSVTAALDRFDDDLLDAAASCGANAWQRFRRVLFPLVLPGMLNGVLLVFITLLGEFATSVLLYAYANRPISMEILAQLRAYSTGTAAAWSVVLLVSILAVVGVLGRLQSRLAR